VNFDPPNRLIRETAPGSGQYTRPQGTIKTEVVIKLNVRNRFKVLASGKIHIINVMWATEKLNLEGDSFNWVVLPPTDKVDPKLVV
jgi:hypothetical protein